MNLKFFDITELDQKTPESAIKSENSDTSGILVSKYLNIHVEKIESLKKMNCGIPQEGVTIYLWTLNSFNAFTFIPYIIDQTGKIIELIISTYSINVRIINALTL